MLAASALALLPLTSVAQVADRFGDPLPAGAVQRLGTLRMRYSGGIGDLAYLPDGRGAVTVGGTVEVWDLAAGEVQARHEVSQASIRGIDVSRDGARLLVADGGGVVREWDLQAAAELRQFDTGQASLSAVHYSPDETRVLTTGSRPPTIKEWKRDTGEQIISIAGAMHYFHEAIYASGGTTAFVNGSTGAGPVLACYDLATGALLTELLKDTYAHYRSLALSPDGQRLLLGSRTRATEWKVDGYELLKEFTGHHGHAVVSVAYCQNPDELLTGSRDGSIRRWNRLEGKVLLRWQPHEGHVTHMEVSPDGQWCLSYGQGVLAETSLETGQPRIAWDRHGGPVQCVAALPAGRVVSGSTDGTLRVWGAVSGECFATLHGAKLGAYAVAASPDGSRVAAGCKDGILREYALPGGELLRELTGHLGYVRSVAYAPDGQALLSSADDGTVRVWGLEAAEPLRLLEGHRGGVLAVAVSADGRTVASGGRDATVRLWSLPTGELTETFTGHRGWVEAVAFVPGTDDVLSAARDGRVLRWRPGRAEPVAEMSPGGTLYALAVSADASTAYAGGSAGVTSVWNLTAASKLGEQTGHRVPVTGLALTSDGRHLTSASEDSTLLVWPSP